MEYKKPCRRCLSEEAGESELAEKIAQRVAAMPEDIKADEQLYRSRLAVCKECGDLISGMCGKCGCYVELRAARKQGYCPSEKRRW